MIHPNNKKMLRKTVKKMERALAVDFGKREPSPPRGTARKKRRSA